MKKKNILIEQKLIKPTLEFKSKILATREKLTPEWISQYHKFRIIFKPPFMQGSESFVMCIKKIVHEWWHPIAIEYTENIRKLIQKLPTLEETKYVRTPILQYIENKWDIYLNKQLTKIIDEKIKEVCEIENYFGTLNDSLIINYFEYLECQHIHT